ncbi:MAG: hypothetical protein KC668_27750, partial [Myxococcales bacterium]|nr:hypothetical protein [Myxococcales bacterium]
DGVSATYEAEGEPAAQERGDDPASAGADSAGAGGTAGGAQAAAAAPTSPPPEPYSLPSATDDAWPAVPSGTTPEGWVFQTIRHETIHVHLAVPPNYRVELGRHSTGLPAVYLHGPGTDIEITYSSGTARFVTTGRIPSSITNVRREASPHGVTMAYNDAQGMRRVASFIRAARCELLWATPDNEDEAFRVCATMRHPPPGPLAPPRARGTNAPWPPQPEFAAVSTLGSVRRMLTGHFSVQVNRRGPCPSAETLVERYGRDIEVRAIDLPNGPALRGQLYERLDRERWVSGVSIWATRAGQCCTGSITGEPVATEAQVTYVAELCDALGLVSEQVDAGVAGGSPHGARSAPRHLEARRGSAVVSLDEGSGYLIDANAPPPPPGQAPAPHVSLHGSCAGGDIPACSEAGTVVRAARTLEDVRTGLEARGFAVTITP